MSSTVLDTKRVFLIASAAREHIHRLSSAIEHHITNSTIYSATDGLEAVVKCDNATPHVVLIDDHLPKMSGLRVIETLLTKRGMEKVAFILISPIPDTEHFVDEVAVGRVQFLKDPEDEQDMSRALARALNFLTNEKGPEFKLKFLAPNDKLMIAGEQAETVYIVKRGALKAYNLQGEKEVMLGSIEAGDFVGEMAYVNGEPRSASVSAVTDCELIEIPINHLDQLLFRKPAWSKALLKTLSKRIKRSNESK